MTLESKDGSTSASLGRRLSTWLALQGFAAAVVVSGTVYGFNHWVLEVRQREELNLKADVVRHALAETPSEGGDEALKQKLSEFLAGHRDMGLRVRDASGRSLFDSSVSAEAALGHRARRTSWEAAWPSKASRPVTVELLLDISRDEMLLRRLGLTLLVASLVGAALVSATGLLLVRRGLRPVKTLVRQLDAVALDKVGLRLDGSSQPQELQPLVARFNVLLTRVEQSYKQLEGFNADVAHEMRTPLTTLIGSSELALSSPRTPEELRDVIESNLEDLRRLSGIVNDMLFLSRADRGAEARRHPTDSIARALSEVMDYYDAVLAERRLTLVCTGDASGNVDVALLRRVASNLMGNATRYADIGSIVHLLIDREGPLVRISVKNHGPTVAQEHLPRLFDRFYRVEKARQAGSTHHGLGLAIVGAIARMHSGAPFATSNNGSTVIGVSIPAEPGAGSDPRGHASAGAS